jgi:hypothetical protein
MDLKQFLRAEWDRVAGYAFILAGLVALVFGFVGVRTAADVVDEISYLVTGGIGAIFLLGVGATLLLSADLHDDFRKLHRVEEKLDDIHRALLERHPDLVVDVRPTQSQAKEAALAPVATASGLLAVRRSRRLALAGSVLAAGLFVAGALLTANQASTDRMAPAVGLALSGAMLVAVTAGLMAGQLKGRLERQTLAAVGPWIDDQVGPAVVAADELWVVDGLALYHRAGCRALEGRTASGRDRAALTAGLRPCGLCEPDAGG